MIKRRKYLALFVFSFLVSNVSITAQTGVNLTGTVLEEEGVPVAYANVLIKAKDGGRIAYFASTDQQGSFGFSLPSGFSILSHYLEINHLSYELLQMPLETGKTIYKLIVYPRINKIQEINIGRRARIEQEGDTLSYDVGSFAKSQDRSIGDAIRRMPGFEIEDNGRISYQGQAISAFYIDGDNLLEGKYGVGTKAIPHAMVLSLEVYKNHQPIKVLKDRIISHDVAINLVIKDDAKLKLSGDAKLGGGLPKQYFAEINTMLFNQRHKLLNVLKGNNTGVDLFQDQENLIEGFEVPSEPRLLSTGTVGEPQLPRSRYYLNNSGGIYTNNLVNLSDQWQLKANIDFVVDRHTMDYTNESAIFTATDSVLFNEQLSRITKPLNLEAKLTAERNADKAYIRNAMYMRYGQSRMRANLSANESLLGQSLGQDIRVFENDMRYIPMLRGKNVLAFNWKLKHRRLPETLAIQPASQIVFVDTEGMYGRLIQEAFVQSTTSNANIEYAPRPRAIIQRYQLHVMNDWQTLRSSIDMEHGTGAPDTTLRGNALKWRKDQFGASGHYSLKRDRTDWSLELPLAYQRIRYADSGFGVNNVLFGWLFNPSVYGKVQLSRSSEALFRYQFNSNIFSDLYSIYQGGILANYRTMQANDAVLQQQRRHGIGTTLKTGSIVNMLFFSLGYDYSHVRSNTIGSVEVNEQVTRMVLVPLKNSVSSHQINAEISKFIFLVGAKSGIRADWQIANPNQFVNGQLLPYRQQTFSLRPDLNFKLFKQVQVEYLNSLTWYRNEPRESDAGFMQRLFMMSQRASLIFSPRNDIHLTARGQHLYTRRNIGGNLSYFFVDANARYKIEAWQTEFELDVTNIANVRTFEYAMLMGNTRFFNRYDIRGAMVLLKANFTF